MSVLHMVLRFSQTFTDHKKDAREFAKCSVQDCFFITNLNIGIKITQLLLNMQLQDCNKNILPMINKTCFFYLKEILRYLLNLVIKLTLEYAVTQSCSWSTA